MSNELDFDVPPEMRLEAAGFRLENLEVDSSIIYMLSPDLRIIYCNRAWDHFAAENGGVRLSRTETLGASVLNVIPEPLRPFYVSGFALARQQSQPWEHDYECSSPDLYRLFHMRVLPLANSYLMVENSLRIGHPHGAERPATPANSALHLGENGILTMCSHCRRTRRIGAAAAPVWDWVPEYLANPPGRVSHGLCRNCRAFFYPQLRTLFA
jgi:hypothetical protein